MSEFENYSNQTPHDPNERPDYSYNWKGNEYDKNNKNKKDKGLVIAIVLGTVALLAVIAAVLVFWLANNSTSNTKKAYMSNSSESSQDAVLSADSNETSEESSSSSQLDESKDESYEVPEFTPSGDSNSDLSNVYTQIYEHCAPSCCTVTVYKNGNLYSIGSGFVIDSKNGYIATNHHVIESGSSFKVVFYDGRTYEARVVGSDSTTDLAVLACDATDLVQVEIGDSNNVKVGENVVAIGTPYDQSLAGTLTCGIISGLARGVEITNSSGKVIKVMTLLQTDCSINPGNSGGPLIDMAGNVIGINSLKLVDEQYEGIGFAIPITDAVEIFKKLIAGEPITDNGVASASPKIGVTVCGVEYGLSYYRINPRCDYPDGLFIANIEADSSSYAAGLQYYDIITELSGYEITTIDSLDAALQNFKAGDEVTVTVFRFDRNFTSGAYETITFRLDAAN